MKKMLHAKFYISIFTKVKQFECMFSAISKKLAITLEKSLFYVALARQRGTFPLPIALVAAKIISLFIQMLFV